MNLTTNNNIYLKNIFLIDWDDTLFPTNWVNSNKIDLRSNNSIEEYKLYFLDLDKVISEFLDSLTKRGEIFIVTNAALNWINVCLKVLPLTSKIIIENKIRIISARDLYSKKTNSTMDWKILTFQNVLKEIFNKMNNIKENTYLNIFSFGDAKYEYVALMKLNEYLLNNEYVNEKNKNNNFNFLLKSIKFMEKPTFEFIIDQIRVVEKNRDLIINKLEYVDLKFD